MKACMNVVCIVAKKEYAGEANNDQNKVDADKVGLIEEVREFVVEYHFEYAIDGENGEKDGRQIDVNIPSDGP